MSSPPALPKQADAATSKRLAVESLLRILGTGLGLGALGRSALGLVDYANAPPVDPLMHTSSVPTPLPVIVHEKKKKKPALPAVQAPEIPKVAEETAPASQPAGDLTQTLADNLPWTPVNPQDPLNDTWGIPAATLAGVGSAYGGWKLIDWLLKSQRKRDVGSQVDEAQREYQQALADQYRAAMLGKQAEDTFGIDDLYEQMCKQGGLGDTLSGAHNLLMSPWRFLLGNQAVESSQGILNAVNALAAAGTGMATYDWIKSRNKQKLLEKAVKMRARQRQFSPTPFYAVTQTQEVPA